MHKSREIVVCDETGDAEMAIIGIDLGTTNSLVCVFQDGYTMLIPNSFGKTLTPSVVSVEEDGSIYVGAVAKERMVTHSEATAASFKRHMGTSKVYELSGRRFTPQELSSFVLRQLKEDAERFLGEEVTEAVISVPAYFNDNQRHATKEAGELAGLKVERLINEPSAAALTASRLGGKDEGSFLVFDFGGGTLDVSVVDYFDNVIEIIAVSGDNHLGGDDFDEKIARYFCEQYQISYQELTAGEKASLLQHAEECKKELSVLKEVTYTFELHGEKKVTLDNVRLAKLGQDMFDRAAQVITRVLSDSGRKMEDMDEVILVGGSSKMPVVGFFLLTAFGKEAHAAASPDEIVGMGAGIYAGIKERKEELRDLVLTDTCPFTLGINVVNPMDHQNPIMSPIIERNSILPSSKKGFYTNASGYQDEMVMKVYQGEGYYCRENIYLGEVRISVPRKKKGENRVEVCFTYDINGILLVEVTDLDKGTKKQAVLSSDQFRLKEEELKRRVEEMKSYKLAPPGGIRTKLALARGERLFVQSVGERRRAVESIMGKLHMAMSTQNDQVIANCLKEAETVFDFLEGKKRQE